MYIYICSHAGQTAVGKDKLWSMWYILKLKTVLSEQGLDTLYKHGICPHPATLVKKAEQIGLNHDEEAIKWKEAIEESHLKLQGLQSLRCSLSDIMYLESQPTIKDFENLVSQNKTRSEPSRPESKDTEFPTLDVECLHLACLSTPGEVAKAVFENQVEMYTVEDATDCFERLVAVSVEESTFTTIEACEIAMKKIEVDMPGYQIIGDNLDLHINVKHMSTNNKNKSLHLFNMITIKDEVSGSHLPNHSQKTLEDVTVADFLPSADDITQLKKDLIPLW